MLEASLLAACGALGILTVVCIYPLILLLLPCRTPPAAPPTPSAWPTVTIITAARNAAALLEAKIQNFRELDYPSECLILLVASDASTDATRSIIEAAGDPRIQLVEQAARRGKAAAMNLAVEQAGADLLLFSDADALLAPDAVRKLAPHFSDPQVGGVCGLRMSARSAARLRDAQQTYINLDSALKRIESARGRISSNDGKIHMIRRMLFSPIPPDVTDDLYTALSVVSQGYRFLFEPEAVAEVKVPSRDALHEIQRRRRIVTRSLTGIFRMRRVLNPARFGWFSIGLLINKVGRRLLPFFLLMLSGGLLGVVLASSALTKWTLVAAVILLVVFIIRPARLNKPLALAQYMLAGFIGSGWGVIDFLSGRRVSVWEPRKTEEVGA
ncbi:MAG: glycosyltransferase [Verrucomicrobia bacterium]|nr:glycosyltransferase [Verrucomicrobiota bacterium]